MYNMTVVAVGKQ